MCGKNLSHTLMIGVQGSHGMANTNETPELGDPPASLNQLLGIIPVSYNRNGEGVVDKH